MVLELQVPKDCLGESREWGRVLLKVRVEDCYKCRFRGLTPCDSKWQIGQNHLSSKEGTRWGSFTSCAGAQESRLRQGYLLNYYPSKLSLEFLP